MADPISDARKLRKIGPAQSHSQASSVELYPSRQAPPAQLAKLRHYLDQMEGLLLDTQA
jgi:hypothetical protein